jgi:hypothetical protein
MLSYASAQAEETLKRHCRRRRVENAPLPAGKTRYPVVLFSPGGGLKALT